MALCPSPNCSSERTLSPQLESPNPKKKKSKILLLEPLQSQTPDSTQSCFSPLPPPRKRNKSPGIRIVGGRIYDSENGKTCHQCRQKTMDFVVACKSPRDDKPCTMKFCHKCLLNRYGEKAVEADQVVDWKCPKCRGICNCSHCMRKRGHQPTGSLLYTAKATGFRTVLEMLTIEGPEKISASIKQETYSDGTDQFIPHSDSFTSPSDGYGKKMKEKKWIKLENIDTDDNFDMGINYDKPQLMEISFNNGGQTEGRIRKKNWKKLARAKSNSNVQEGTREDYANSNSDVQEGLKEDGAENNGGVQEGTKDGAQTNGSLQEGMKEDGAQNNCNVLEGMKEDGAQNNGNAQEGMNEDCAQSNGNAQEGMKEDGAQLEKTQATL